MAAVKKSIAFVKRMRKKCEEELVAEGILKLLDRLQRELELSSVPEMDATWLDRLMERRRAEGVMASASTS